MTIPIIVGGAPIFSFRTEYGLIYALNGVLPGWFWYKDEASEQNCAALKRSNLTNLDKMIFYSAQTI